MADDNFKEALSTCAVVNLKDGEQATVCHALEAMKGKFGWIGLNLIVGLANQRLRDRLVVRAS
ncbi:hypothetical protein [Mycobacterium sp.]|jgi:hypothetical protein|uniref:hypothetical protein n=1 Tax=Mycobacterium sp. TaxID=1785 RepID=UPI003F9D2C03